MDENFLLKTQNARRLYVEHARSLPIIDFHNHISVGDIAADRKYDSIYDLWLATDPYKHRLMRICGVDEYYITGGATPYEKFEKYCRVFPYLVGNPVYDWSRMELSEIFGINEMLCEKNAKYVYDKCGEMLASSEYSNNSILSRFNVEYQSPVATLLDDLSGFDGVSVAPSLRGDNLLLPTADFIAELSHKTGVAIKEEKTYLLAVSRMLDSFSSAGCRFADHALDAGFFEDDVDGKRAELLTLLGTEYAKRGWTLLLHIGAKRDTSSRLAALAGRAGGYAAVGGSANTSALCDLLGKMELNGGLPDTVLFPLNMADQAAVAVMQGSYSEDGTPSKVQLGPSWWWCDHTMGIENTLSSIASFGVLSQFIGMTTDSRSILSFIRHDYFRRILCSWLDRENTERDWNAPFDVQGEIIEKICYKNAKLKIEGDKK